ncbi:hypothetical protein CEJ63_22230, partial [Acinetobacter baumannii]
VACGLGHRAIAEYRERHAAFAGELRVHAVGIVGVGRVRIQRGAADDLAGGRIDHGVQAGLPTLIDAVVEVPALDFALAPVAVHVVGPVLGQVALDAEHEALGVALHVLATLAGIDVEAAQGQLAGAVGGHQGAQLRRNVGIVALDAQGL